MSTRSFFGGVLLGLAIDLALFLVDDNTGFELWTLLLCWGVLAVSSIALYTARPPRFWIRPPNRTTVASQRVSTQVHGPSKQRAAASEADARSPASQQGN